MVFLNNITMRHFYLTFLILLVCNMLQAQEEVFMYNENNKEFFEANDSVKYIKSFGKQNIDNDYNYEKQIKNRFADNNSIRVFLQT